MTLAGLFDRLQRGNLVASKRLTGMAIAAFTAPFFLLGAAGVRINSSPSLPLGFYTETSDKAARLIEFCPPEPYGSFMAGRGYRSAGNCPDGGSPLMKPVIASAGDIVEISQHGLAVNGVLLSNTAPKSIDSKGRPMTAWTSGQYRVAVGFVWVASTYNAWSFDSRYFGPIPTEIIRNRLKPLLTL
jgi:conjugative transfer signal peptidase TraF